MSKKHKILMVDDEVKVCEIIGNFLQKKGYEVSKAHNGLEAIEQCASLQPDIILMDIRMPKMDGIEALKRIKKDYQDIEVIMATAMGETETAVSCLKDGAFGFLIKPLNLSNLILEVNKAIDHRKLVLENRDYQENLEKKVEERTKEVHALNKSLKNSFLNTVRISLGLVEVFDPFLGGHSRRVLDLSKKIGALIGLPHKNMFDLEAASLLHEVGRVAIPDHVKDKPFSELKTEEVKIVQKYPIFSQKIVSPSKQLHRAGIIIRHHLEHVDGSGFPDRLKGDTIPLESKILGISNAFDEIAHRRKFTAEELPNEKYKIQFAFDRLQKLAGKYYDKNIVELLADVVDNLSEEIKPQALFSVHELRPGMVAAVDIVTKDGRLLLAEGNTLNHIHILKIQTLSEARLLGSELYIYERKE